MDISREFLQQVKEIVCSCEPIMTRAFTVAEKGSASNLVTTSDTAVQEMLKEKLGELLPQAVFLGEETESEASEALMWVVDPIDGTSNFVRGMRLSAISVALVEDGEEVLTGTDVENAEVQQYQNPDTGNIEYVVALELDSEGTEKFAEATTELAGTGQI